MGFGWGLRDRADEARRHVVRRLRNAASFSHESDDLRLGQSAPRLAKCGAHLPDLDRLPDFMVVGPQRTGTTWLHRNLTQHPQIFMSRKKELFFFSSLARPDLAKHRSDDVEWYLSHFYDGPLEYLLKQKASLHHYRELYRPLVRGEATASYAAMDKARVEEIARLRPDVRIILMIRDPIERAWSHAKLDLLKKPGRTLTEVPAREFERFFLDPYQVACGRYSSMISTWSAVLGPEKLFLGRYGDLIDRPSGLLLDLFAFLGVRRHRKYIRLSSKATINATQTIRIPDRYLSALTEVHGSESARLRASGYL